MDQNSNLIELLQKAELKAKMSLYYLRENNKRVSMVKNSLVDHGHPDPEVNELYAASQIYCKSLEKQLKDKSNELKALQVSSEELSRHNEAMLEEIAILNRKIEMHPKTMQDLKSEIDKLTRKVEMLEEQKRFMESQATQNENKVMQSQNVQQDLVDSQLYIQRLQRYINTNKNGVVRASPPVLMSDKSVQTMSTLPVNQASCMLVEQRQNIKEMRCVLAELKRECRSLATFRDDIAALRTVVNSGSGNKGFVGNHRNGVDKSPAPRDLMLNVDRCVVMGRLLPPLTKEQILTTHTSNTNNTDIIVTDNNSNIVTFTLDVVLPLTAPQKQLGGVVSTISKRLSEEGRSVLLIMLGDSGLTLYGNTDEHGLIYYLMGNLLEMRDSEDILTVSVGTFLRNQMCDGLSEFANSEGKVTAIPISDLADGIELLSGADIPDGTDQVLHQFTLRRDVAEDLSVSILECESIDTESNEALKQFRDSGKIPRVTQPNVLLDTIRAYCEKNGAITVYINLKPNIASGAENQRLLKYGSHILGNEPVVKTKKKGLFSFRS